MADTTGVGKDRAEDAESRGRWSKLAVQVCPAGPLRKGLVPNKLDDQAANRVCLGYN